MRGRLSLTHLDPDLRTAPQPERETVAEATAFVVAAYQGIDTGSYSFPYIAGWAGTTNGAALLKQVLSRVQAIAYRVLQGIAGDEPADVGADAGDDGRQAA